MKDAKDNNLCSNGGDLLVYLYAEMPAADREPFELHLADCVSCIDEFAEIAQARYPVYEWKALEFDPMPTPRFEVPVEQATAGIFDKLRIAFTANRGFAFGGVAAATILVAIFAGYAVYIQNSSENVVAVVQAEPPASPVQKVVAPPAGPELKSSIREEPTERVAAKPKSISKPAEIVKVSVRKSKRHEPARGSELKASPVPQKQIRSIPVLSIAEDDEDDSLRLSDLFEDIGAS
jgi:hypothetical protein